MKKKENNKKIIFHTDPKTLQQEKIYLVDLRYHRTFPPLTHEAINLKKTLKATLTLILLVTTILLQSPLHAKGEPNERRFTITSTVTYSNHGTTTWNLTGEDYAISLFMNNSWQTVSLIEHSLPLNSIRTDTDGNLIGFLDFPQLNQSQSVSYTVKYDIISKPRPLPNITEAQSQNLSDIPQPLKNEYCKKEGPWLTDNPTLQQLAHNITGNEKRVLSIIKNLVTWIADDKNIKYDSAEVPRYPNETLIEQEGDCDDQAILLITLCRILGIPAYLQIGAIYDFTIHSSDTYWQGHVTSALNQIAWHGWAIVYIPPWRWLPVDLTYVLGGLSDPLNSIKRAAVTGQGVIQYMNFTHTDYVGTSHRLRDFIQRNGFYIRMVDEMQMNIDFGVALELIKLVFEGTLIAAAVIAVSLATIFIYKWKKTEKPKVRLELFF